MAPNNNSLKPNRSRVSLLRKVHCQRMVLGGRLSSAVRNYVMKILFITLFIFITCYAQEKELISLVNKVKYSIIEMDSTSFSSCISDKYFDYFEGDLDVDPTTVDSNYYTLLPSGYYGKELLQFVENKKDIIKFFTTEGGSYPRNKCPVSEKSFSPLQKISKNRFEVILRRFSEAGFLHLVFLKIENKWKLSGSFSEFLHTEPCNEWKDNSWENN